jgi:hypothetical protein
MKATTTRWPPLQNAYQLVHQAAQMLANHEQHTGAQVRERYLAFVSQMQDRKPPWVRSVRPLSMFVTSPTTSQVVYFRAMTPRLLVLA